jgi:hypothetical protein
VSCRNFAEAKKISSHLLLGKNKAVMMSHQRPAPISQQQAALPHKFQKVPFFPISQNRIQSHKQSPARTTPIPYTKSRGTTPEPQEPIGSQILTSHRSRNRNAGYFGGRKTLNPNRRPRRTGREPRPAPERKRPCSTRSSNPTPRSSPRRTELDAD